MRASVAIGRDEGTGHTVRLGVGRRRLVNGIRSTSLARMVASDRETGYDANRRDGV